MRILITGGAGFIGSNLALHLRMTFPGAEIVCMDNLHRQGSELNVPRLQVAGVVFHRGDVRRMEDFPAGAFDFLVECSAEPSVLAGLDGDPDYLFHTNVNGAYHCLEVARKRGARLIFLSTSRVYPIATLENHPWEEHDTRFVWRDEGTSGISARGVSEGISMSGARSLYGFTKLAAEQMIEEYRAAYGLQAVVNRCGVIAGPWQFGKVDQGVVALWVMAHVFGRPLSYIGYGGSGKQVRDVLHVADLCDLITEQMQNFETWDGWLGNVSGGLENRVSLCELTQMCREESGAEIVIGSVAETRPADLRVFIADCSRLLEKTSWRPRRKVGDIVRDTCAWAQDQREDLIRLG
ncbi:MAG TPA: NAD-dependent epimerase/dehydratase family protein [Prosthecobacter sp.]|nr:NAD-dependent epimerase/dehydratase family protein [Prosthecobacter sp.]